MRVFHSSNSYQSFVCIAIGTGEEGISLAVLTSYVIRVTDPFRQLKNFMSNTDLYSSVRYLQFVVTHVVAWS